MSGYKGDGRGRGGPPNKGDVYRTGPLDVIVNCFRVTQLPRRTYYHYHGGCFLSEWSCANLGPHCLRQSVSNAACCIHASSH